MFCSVFILRRLKEDREVKGLYAACQASAEPGELPVIARAQTGHWGFLTYCLKLFRFS